MNTGELHLVVESKSSHKVDLDEWVLLHCERQGGKLMGTQDCGDLNMETELVYLDVMRKNQTGY